MIDIRETILAQYANSPALTGIIQRFNAAADPRRLIEVFLHDVWNPLTATGWGLDVWGRIVGVGRVLKISQVGWIGAAEASAGSGDYPQSLNNGAFYNGQDDTQNYALSDEVFRRLIFAKAAANISSGSIADINRILMLIFGGDGRIIYVSEGGDSQEYIGFSETSYDGGPPDHEPQPLDNGIFFSENSLNAASGKMTIFHNWTLSPPDQTVIESSGVLPRPAGVEINYQYLARGRLWNPVQGNILSPDNQFITGTAS